MIAHLFVMDKGLKGSEFTLIKERIEQKSTGSSDFCKDANDLPFYLSSYIDSAVGTGTIGRIFSKNKA